MVGWSPARSALFGIALLMIALGMAAIAAGVVLSHDAEDASTRDRCGDALAAAGLTLLVEGGLGVYLLWVW